MEIQTLTKTQNSLVKEFSGGKKRSELGRYDCLSIFSNSGFPVKLLIDVCFAYKDIRL